MHGHVAAHVDVVVDWLVGPGAWERQARGEVTRRAVIRVSDRPGVGLSPLSRGRNE